MHGMQATPPPLFTSKFMYCRLDDKKLPFSFAYVSLKCILVLNVYVCDKRLVKIVAVFLIVSLPICMVPWLV
jgi:hypothetical protein